MADRYKNQTPAIMNTGAGAFVGMVRDYARIRTKLRPRTPLPVMDIDLADRPDASTTRVCWFGHSASLLEIEGKRLLLDPMLGKASSPFPIFNSKRYSRRLPITADQIAEVGEIDAIVLSHNHYDHMHDGSIKRLKDRTKRFHVPAGVGKYLIAWGVSPDKISEHNWWDEFEYAGLTFACTPAKHFSGRGLTDRDRSLWCSWVIAGKNTRVYFSGDSGYAPHFKEIGSKYGPFDLTLMECGQYDERWSAIHMMPEQTVQAHIDVKGGILVPIHWGAFTLALHDWTDPIERAVKAAAQHGVRIATPRIGEAVVVGAGDVPATAWWRQL